MRLILHIGRLIHCLGLGTRHVHYDGEMVRGLAEDHAGVERHEIGGVEHVVDAVTGIGGIRREALSDTCLVPGVDPAGSQQLVDLPPPGSGIEVAGQDGRGPASPLRDENIQLLVVHRIEIGFRILRMSGRVVDVL